MAASVNRKLLSDALLTLTLLLRCCLSMFGSTKVTSSNRIPFLRTFVIAVSLQIENESPSSDPETGGDSF